MSTLPSLKELTSPPTLGRSHPLMCPIIADVLQRITYNDILMQTGVNTATLTKLANDRAAMVGISVIDRLCAYFDCQPGDLFIHIAETES